MLRAVLLGVLSVSSVVACKSSTDTSAKSQPGVAAGKVIEVKGTVTVKHGDASRPLAVGEAVEGDDTVITGGDGNVVIELAHNLVRWELGPNKTQKVNASIAWKAAKSTGPAADVEQDTAAAGRPAERSAVGTTVTADEGEAPPAAEMAPAAAPAAASDEDAAPAPAKRERSRTRVRRESPKAAAPEPAEEAPPPPPAEETVRTTRGATRGPTRGPTRGAATATVEAPRAPVAGGAATAKSLEVAPKQPAAASVSTQVGERKTALKACLGAHADDVNLFVFVSGGKATTVKVSSKTAVSAALEACVKKVVASIKFGADGKASIVIKP